MQGVIDTSLMEEIICLIYLLIIFTVISQICGQLPFSTLLSAAKWKGMGYSVRARTLNYSHCQFVTFTLHCIASKRKTQTTTLQQYYFKTFGILYFYILTSHI
jgi:ABC-type dipeptide/oligopeptide/nickel transport system permease subunit